MGSALPPLGGLEHEILTILWAGGELTAVEVRKKVARKLKDATIRTVLRRLEEKEYVTHRVEAGTFIYRPKESADSAAADALKGILDRFCGGSIERGLQALVDAALVEPKQFGSGREPVDHSQRIGCQSAGLCARAGRSGQDAILESPESAR